jgi:hypothetical protein
MASPVTAVAARPVLNLTPFLRKSLLEEEGTLYANPARYSLVLSVFFDSDICLAYVIIFVYFIIIVWVIV